MSKIKFNIELTESELVSLMEDGFQAEYLEKIIQGHARPYYEDVLSENVIETSKLTSLDTRILSHIACFEHDLDSGVSYQSRPKGGQQVGAPSSSFCTTSPSAVVCIRRFIKRLRKEISRV